MAVNIEDVNQTSELSRELCWLESALDMHHPNEWCKYLLCEELFGKRVIVATNRQRLHIGTQWAHVFPVGFLPHPDSSYTPGNRYFPYETAIQNCTGAKIIVNRALLEQHLTKLLKAAPKSDTDKLIKLSFDENSMNLVVYNALHGWVRLNMPCSMKGKPKPMRLNARYLLDAIAGSEVANVSIQQDKSDHKAICVSPGLGRVAFMVLFPE